MQEVLVNVVQEAPLSWKPNCRKHWQHGAGSAGIIIRTISATENAEKQSQKQSFGLEHADVEQCIRNSDRGSLWELLYTPECEQPKDVLTATVSIVDTALFCFHVPRIGLTL
jgi:hypothetical protein